LALAVGRVLADPVAAARRARRSRARLGTEFDWTRIAGATADVYASACRGARLELPRPKIPTGNALTGGRG
jgi:glycogen(starch) synthase